MSEHVCSRSWLDLASDCWRCECGAPMPRDKKDTEPIALSADDQPPIIRSYSGFRKV